MSSASDLTSRLLRHERAIVACSIAALVLFSGTFLLTGAGMSGADMAAMAPPGLPALVLMWWIMMVAMMLPSASPAILLYARVRSTRDGSEAIAGSWLFLAGYLIVWLGFSVLVALAQHRLAHGSMNLNNDYAASGLLIVAGIYQLSPLKSACLKQCRSPAQFISRHWRPGPSGAMRLGLLHGAVCVACCWMLMLLLFVGGVMNFLWITLLAIIVGAEKLLPRGDLIGRVIGIGLIGWGAFRLVL